MLGLCVYALVALAAQAVLTLDAQTRSVLQYADSAICLLVLADFVLCLYRAPNRWRYLYTWGWIDLASSIPVFPQLRWGRVARIVRVVRVLRAVRATKTISKFVLEKRSQSTFLAAALLAVLFVFIASVAILQIENVPGSNIHGPGDAIWWAFETVTSVDYGDRYPVTLAGRLIAAFLIIVGAALFGALAGSVAMWFLAPGEAKERKEIAELRESIEELKRLIETRK